MAIKQAVVENRSAIATREFIARGSIFGQELDICDQSGTPGINCTIATFYLPKDDSLQPTYDKFH